MTVTDKVLGLLYDRPEGFFSLEELSAAASVDRRAVAEALETLTGRGQAFERSPHGVRLIRPAKLDAHLIERGLGTHRVGRSVLCFDEVDSTNDVAMASARQGGTDGLAVTAEFQRAGRGRHGRRWASPPGTNVLLSILLLESGGDLCQEALTIAAGLAVAEALADACDVDCRLKWPNDVLLDRAKVSGVLAERGGEQPCMVVGVGINVNASPPADEIDCPATDLAAAVGHPVERVEVVRHVLRRMDGWVGRLAAGGDEELHDGWVARCGMINERVTVLHAGRRYVGRVLDVSPLEGLVLSCDQGKCIQLSAAGSTVVDGRGADE